MRATPPGDDASRRIASPLPYRRSSAEKPTGPIPRTPAITAHASRSSVGRLGRKAASKVCSGPIGPATWIPISAWVSMGRAPTGPDPPTPSTSAGLGRGQPHVRRAEPCRLVEGLGAPARVAVQVGDGSRNTQQALSATPAGPLELGELDDMTLYGRGQTTRLAQSPAR